MRHTTIISLLLSLLPSGLQASSYLHDSCINGQDSLVHTPSRYELHTEHYKQTWSKLIPSHVKVQYAGSIGVVSGGIGWHYGHIHDTWETDFMVGIVPKYSSSYAKTTFTIRQTYIPWHLPLNRTLSFLPFTCGLFFSTITGGDFWTHQPDKYPKKYYGFSTKIRSHIFIGQRLKFNIPQNQRLHHKSVEIYYELSTCDLYVASYVTNSNLPLRDVLSLSLGLKLELF